MNYERKNKVSDNTDPDTDNLESKLGEENFAFVWLEKICVKYLL